ncbi:hypothetical protein DYU11_22950 [Fibrisoma montanum]|uniref:Lipoprotein n=1 Tax=Fibrisoma montanum TaxID=2305895 RepID=A0A418M2K8_9BACT|nr:hypothetical protein [Fibrisoma montanum]RIV19789.1 hypothetical protein DYU11_22950 [Fibrisoma montanum]
MQTYRKLTFLLLLSFLSCEFPETALPKTLDLGAFQVSTPEGWWAKNGVGYDSQVGELTDRATTLSFDYGWYSYRFDKETTATHERTQTTIDGRPALLVRPLQKGRGIIGVFIQKDTLNRLTIVGHNVKDETTILNILRSVRFR